ALAALATLGALSALSALSTLVGLRPRRARAHLRHAGALLQRRAAAAAVDLRLAFLVELDELVVAARDLGDRRLAGQHGVGDALRVELDRAHRVVIARDRIVDAFGRAVRVDDRDDRNAELARLANRDLL